MKKEDITSAVIYLLLVAAAIIVGCTVIKDAFQNYDDSLMSPYLFSILTIALGLAFNIVGLELLHVVGAKIGGYEVLSINMIGFCFEKIEGKWRFCFKAFDGLTGETIIAPKRNKLSIKPYVWLPLLGYACELVLGIVIVSVVQNTTSTAPLGWLSVGSLLFIVISSLIALYNIVPIKLDCTTDGYRLLLASNPTNFEAFNELMRIEGLQRKGEKIENIKVFDKITDFSASVNLLSIYQDLSEKKYDKALELIDKMLVDTSLMKEETANRFYAQKIYILVMKGDLKVAKEFYDKEVNDKLRRFIANDDSMESLRAYALIAGFLDQSQSEVVLVRNRLPKIIKATLPSKIEIEQKLFDEAIDKVYEEHQDWKKDIAA